MLYPLSYECVKVVGSNVIQLVQRCNGVGMIGKRQKLPVKHRSSVLSRDAKTEQRTSRWWTLISHYPKSGATLRRRSACERCSVYETVN